MSQSDDEVAQKLEERLDAFQRLVDRYASATGLPREMAEEALKLIQIRNMKRLVGFRFTSQIHGRITEEYIFE